ncbi:hypothetical protein [Paenibacillus cremeus]|uniref:Uncharacterized protein n=1 Tax=Paenibacillus cremeus TaxID=2163881 RepID=A0A559K8C8_9BACL|nr:hypothetical protein [Paenibacillus cremeus]TVY08378.1 hypothetical protein FPZ49_19235 [Paenibacillus cremeus]
MGKKWRAGIGLMLSVFLFVGSMPHEIFANTGGGIGTKLTAGQAGTVWNSVYGNGGQMVMSSTHEVPVFSPLPVSLTNERQVGISGKAKAGDSVRLWYSLDRGEASAIGEPTIADNQGKFAIDVALSDLGEGTLTFYATALKNGVESMASNPLTLVTDWTPAGDVFDVTWEMFAVNQALVKWNPPMVEGETAAVQDPQLVGYELENVCADKKLMDLKNPNIHQDLVNVKPNGKLNLRIRMMDRAGNRSDGTEVTLTAPPAQVTKLSDLSIAANDLKFTATLSGDGSTAFYTDSPLPGLSGTFLFAQNLMSGHREMLTPTRNNEDRDRVAPYLQSLKLLVEDIHGALQTMNHDNLEPLLPCAFQN